MPRPSPNTPALAQAAILTGRRGKSAITLAEIDDSVDRIVAGMEGTPMTDGKSKSLVAYHEVGHAVCGTLTPGHDQVQKVRDFSVILPSRALKVVHHLSLVVSTSGCARDAVASTLLLILIPLRFNSHTCCLTS